MSDSGVSGHRRRLRARFLRHGVHGFEDYELLELLLTYAIPRKDVKPMARSLLRKYRNLSGVLDATPEEIQSMEGLGEASAILLRLVRELNLRYLDQDMRQGEILDTPEKVAASLRLALQGRKTEAFGAMFLNQQHRYLCQEILFTGTVDRSAVFPREIVRRALDLHAKALIVFHNHPGGGLRPSASDIELTARIDAACKAVELRLLDHFLVAGGRVLSFREQGWYAFC